MLHNGTSLTVFLGCRQAELELEGKGQNAGNGFGKRCLEVEKQFKDSTTDQGQSQCPELEWECLREIA